MNASQPMMRTVKAPRPPHRRPAPGRGVFPGPLGPFPLTPATSMYHAPPMAPPRTTQASIPAAPPPPVRTEAQQEDAQLMLAALRRKVLQRDPEYLQYANSTSLMPRDGLLDYVIAAEGEPHTPDEVFGRLRWGGQFVYVSRDRAEVESLPERFAQRGYMTVAGPEFIRTGLGIPLFSKKAWYFAARKLYLVRPREFSDRFTYHVQLEPRQTSEGGEWVVRKEIPTLERVVARLRAKGTDLPLGVIERRARKFVEQIFPLFLTREAAMLKIIHRDLPPQYANRFPHVVYVEKDSRGYVQRLWTNWLRVGGPALSQIEFAKQSAELLAVLHDKVGIMHLDLRLDNFVITENGVGFVDFGSAVRVNENIQSNAVLSTLFGELMRTSQIQRMLDKMRTTGAVTSSLIADAYQQVDKAVDLFYLAVQISAPLSNPDFRGLVKYDPHSTEAKALAQLTNDILRPADPNHPKYRTARDILEAVLRIEAELKGRASPAPSDREEAPVPLA